MAGEDHREHRVGIYTYRATLVLVVLSLFALGWTAVSSPTTSVAVGDVPVPTTVAPTTTVPSTTTTTTPPPPTEPVMIPVDTYAPEPIVKLGTIEIPAIGITRETYQGVTLRNIDNGPSHWPGTALPGQRGNTVFAGHRVTHDRPFRNLDKLVGGDEVIFTVNGVRSVYKVTSNLIVQPRDTWIADQTDTATGTLYACHPPGSAAQRFVVRLALA